MNERINLKECVKKWINLCLKNVILLKGSDKAWIDYKPVLYDRFNYVFNWYWFIQ